MKLLQRWHVKSGLLLVGVLAVAALVVVGCTKAQATGNSGTPDRTEIATLVPPPQVPPPIARKEPALVKVELETVEQRARLADGVEYDYWTFNGTVPGPMVRVREGDTVEIVLKNSPESRVAHSIDLHAVTGPGGGAVATQVSPGQSKGFQFKALKPGLYVYHCATAPVAQHIANGMYGLILVEPEAGLPSVDKEFYVMQGEVYTQGKLGEAGVQKFSLQSMLDENPQYVVFNGAVGSITGEKALTARVGEKVRIYFGVGGPNLTSSFHVIGEILDEVHQEGAAEATHSIQTTYVPAGGATWVDFQVEVPGTYVLVDHSLSRLLKGAAGHLVVEGEAAPGIFEPLQPGVAASH